MIVEIFAYLTAMVWQMVVEKTPTNKPATVTGQFYTLISKDTRVSFDSEAGIFSPLKFV